MKLSFETTDALKTVPILAEKLRVRHCVAEGVLFSSGDAVIEGDEFHVPAGG